MDNDGVPEGFRIIKPFPDYAVNINGHVFNRKTRQFMETTSSGCSVKISYGGQRLTLNVNRLVEELFYDEERRTIPGYHDYTMDVKGRIYSKRTGRELRTPLNSSVRNFRLRSHGHRDRVDIYELHYETWPEPAPGTLQDYVDESYEN